MVFATATTEKVNVQNLETDTVYTLTVADAIATACTCPDYTFRRAAAGESCKHMAAYDELNEHVDSTTTTTDGGKDRTNIETIDGSLLTTGAVYHTYLGVDNNGYHHHYVGDTDKMFVVHPDGDVLVKEMDGRSLETWAQFIEGETAGWYSLELSTISAKDLFGALE